MYKFVTIQGSCGSPYDIGKCEDTANKMLANGYELVQVYQTTMTSCMTAKSVLVMVFKSHNP